MLFSAANHHQKYNEQQHKQHNQHHPVFQQQPMAVPNPPRVRTQSISEELEEARRRLQELQVLQAQSNENAPLAQSSSALYEPEVFTAADAQWDAPIQHSSFSAPLSTPFWDRIAAATSEDTSTNNVRDTAIP